MIISLVLKNIRIILRNPFTILFLIIAPMLLMFIVGISYSNSTLSNIEVGIINANNFFASNSNINFVNYQSNISCSRDLINSKINLCVEVKTTKTNKISDKNSYESVEVIYYIDNSRAQLSGLIIKSLDKIIEDKTKTITKKTIKDILSEINETINFMEGSLNSVSTFKKELRTSTKKLEEFNSNYIFLLNDFEREYKLIKENSNELNSNLEGTIKNLENLKTELNKLQSSESDVLSSIKEIKTNYNLLYDGLEKYGNEVDSNIFSYVTFQTLENFEESLDDLDDNFYSLSNLVKVSDSKTITSLEDLKKLNQDSNDFFENFDKIDKNLNEGKDQLSDLIILLKQKEKELDLLESEIRDKLNYFKDLSSRDESEITEPIVTKKEFLLNNYKMVHKLAPTIVILVLLFIGLLLSSIIVSIEVNSKAYFRNLISPVKQYKFVIALFLTSLIIILFQVFFLLFILSQYFGIVNIYTRFLPTLFVIVHLLVIFILLGMFIAYYSLSLQFSILINTFVILFLFLLSGIIVPLETMPSGIAAILRFNPVVFGSRLIRLIFNFEKSSWFNIIDFIIIYIYIFILVGLLSYAVLRRMRKLF